MSANNANGNTNPGANTGYGKTEWEKNFEAYKKYRAQYPDKALQPGSKLHSWEKNQRTALDNRDMGLKSGPQVSTWQAQQLEESNFQRSARKRKGIRRAIEFCLKCCPTFHEQNQHWDYFKEDAVFQNKQGENSAEGLKMLRDSVTHVGDHKKYIAPEKRELLTAYGIQLHPNASVKPQRKPRKNKAQRSTDRSIVSHSGRKGSESSSSIPSQRNENSDSDSSMSSESDTYENVANFSRKKSGKNAPVKNRSNNFGRRRLGRKRL